MRLSKFVRYALGEEPGYVSPKTMKSSREKKKKNYPRQKAKMENQKLDEEIYKLPDPQPKPRIVTWDDQPKLWTGKDQLVRYLDMCIEEKDEKRLRRERKFT